MYFVKVYVTYKESILDPQGEAVKEAVHRLGFTEVAEIRVGKYFIFGGNLNEIGSDCFSRIQL